MGGGVEIRGKRKRETEEEGRERSACNQSPHKNGRKMLIGRDMSRAAVNCSACFKITNYART